jgi:hypothetical protein
MSTRKLRLRPSEFLIPSAKRLLQQNRPLAGVTLPLVMRARRQQEVPQGQGGYSQGPQRREAVEAPKGQVSHHTLRQCDCRPHASCLAPRSTASHDHPARDGRALASSRLSLLLALEVAPTGRATADRHGAAWIDPADERRKSAFEANDPRRWQSGSYCLQFSEADSRPLRTRQYWFRGLPGSSLVVHTALDLILTTSLPVFGRLQKMAQSAIMRCRFSKRSPRR